MFAAAIYRYWRTLTKGWRRSNCISFAVALYLRRWARARRNDKRHDDYLVLRLFGRDYLLIRLSRVRWGIFHVLHGKLDRNTGQIKVVSYKPDVAEKTGFAPIFKGHVERGDAVPNSDSLKGKP
jgi:hypothetical protein